MKLRLIRLIRLLAMLVIGTIAQIFFIMNENPNVKALGWLIPLYWFLRMYALLFYTQNHVIPESWKVI